MGLMRVRMRVALLLAVAALLPALAPGKEEKAPAVKAPPHVPPAIKHGTKPAGTKVKLYATKGGDAGHVCRQCEVDKTFVTLAKHFLLFKEGTCADHGFKLVEGTDKMKMPR